MEVVAYKRWPGTCSMSGGGLRQQLACNMGHGHGCFCNKRCPVRGALDHATMELPSDIILCPEMAFHGVVIFCHEMKLPGDVIHCRRVA